MSVLALVSLASGATAAAQVEIYPGTNIQSVIWAHPAGTTYVLKPGAHRLQTFVPQSGDTITGEPGAVLSGAYELTHFQWDGSAWFVTGQAQEGPVVGSVADGICRHGAPRCGHPEDVFIDDVPQFHVGSRDAVVPGTWFFDYEADRIYIGTDPAWHRVETSVVSRAILSGIETDVTIRNLVIEKYAVPTGQAAVALGERWALEHSTVRLNHYSGVWTNSDSVTRNSLVTSNGCFGFQGAGDSILVESNEISYNGYAGYDPFWASGGTKWSYTSRLTLRNNFSHHNYGPGLWTDVDNIHTLFEYNRVEDNERGGIFHELGYDAVIRFNSARRNGAGKRYPWWTTGAGIEILSARNVTVYGNYVEDNFQGIAALNDHRGSGAYGPWEVTNLQVFGNIVVSTQAVAGEGRSGMIDTLNNDAFDSAKGNRFFQNTYFLGGNRSYFMWMSSERTEQEWTEFGQDTNGVFNR